MTTKRAIAKQSVYELALKMAKRAHPDLPRTGQLLEEAHIQGDRRATYALATWYLFGHGTYPRNLRKAVGLLKLAAETDIAAAHFDLAVCYETGEGVRESAPTAFRHYLAAALNGDNDSLPQVGRCLFYGIGVKRDRMTAEIWFRRAEALGVRIAPD